MFKQGDQSRDMSVFVPVPSCTLGADISVVATAERLRVSVVGHHKQPTVLDGELSYDIDADLLSWALEGSGSNRRLVISLEKAEPVDWAEGLFRQHMAAEAPPPEPPRARAEAAAAVPAAVAPGAAAVAPQASLATLPEELAARVPSTASDAAPGASLTAAATAASALTSAPTPAPPTARAAPAPAASVARCRKGFDYSRWDNLDVSSDDEDTRAREPSSIGDGSPEIWDDLMSGKKRLLTKDGIVGKEGGR